MVGLTASRCHSMWRPGVKPSQPVQFDGDIHICPTSHSQGPLSTEQAPLCLSAKAISHVTSSSAGTMLPLYHYCDGETARHDQGRARFHARTHLLVCSVISTRGLLYRTVFPDTGMHRNTNTVRRKMLFTPTENTVRHATEVDY